MGKKSATEMGSKGKMDPKNRNQSDMYSEIFSDETDSEDNEISTLTKPNERFGCNSSKATVTAKNDMKSSKDKRTKSPMPKNENVSLRMKNLKRRQQSIPEPNTSKGNSSSDDSESELKQYEFEDDEMSSEEEIQVDTNKSASEDDNSSEGEDSESDSEDGDDNGHQTVLRKQLKDLSFEELESLKQKMGLKEYNEAMFGSKKGSKNPKKAKRRKFERSNKNKPREISSKLRVPKLRQTVKVAKKINKDPRFDDACGEYNEKIWNTEYSFIRDIQKKEAQDLSKTIKHVNDKTKQREMRRFIQRVNDKEKMIATKAQEHKKRIQDKEDNRKRMEEGKRPFYMKKSTKKLVELVEKYDELKASGKLENYLKKKRKKNAFRDKKTLC